MKNTKFLWVLFYCFFPLLLSAQLEKGNKTYTSDGGLNYFFEENFNFFNLDLATTRTWFVGKGIEVGLDFGANFFRGDIDRNEYQIIPNFNYYFNPSGSGPRFFLGAEVGLIGTSGEDSFDDNANLVFGFGAGALQFLNPNTAAQFRLGYRYKVDEGIDDDYSFTFSARLKAFMDNSSSADGNAESANLGKGALLIGGSSILVDLNTRSLNGAEFTEDVFEIRSRLIYLVSDQFGVGGTIEVIHVDQDRQTNRELLRDRTILSFLPEFRYYFKPIAPDRGRNFFAHLLVGTERIELQGIEDTRAVFNAGVGLTRMIGQNVAIETILSYGRQDVNFNTFVYENRIGTNMIIQYFWNR